MTTAVAPQKVVKGKRVPADRHDVTTLVAAYRTGKAGAKAAEDAASAARDGLLSLVGDGDTLVDSITGLTLCTLPVRKRDGLPPFAELREEFADMPAVQARLDALLRETLYRVVAK